MTLSSMVVSRDWQEIGVLECILGSLHMDVQVETDPERARAKLMKSKIDALIVDCDLDGTGGFLKSFHAENARNSVPLVIVSGSSSRESLQRQGAAFVFEKPISVEQAVHTLSAARNMVVEGRLRYHRMSLEMPVSLSYGRTKKKLKARICNVSQGGLGIRADQPLCADGPLKIQFDLPGTKLAIHCDAEVAWMDRHGNAGIRFLDGDRQTKRDLELWLERRYFMPLGQL